MNIQELTTVVKSDPDWVVTLRILRGYRLGEVSVSVDAMHRYGGTLYLTDFSFNADPAVVKRCLDESGLDYQVSCFDSALLVKYGFESGDPQPETPAEQPARPKTKCEACGKTRYNMKTPGACLNFTEQPAKRLWQCLIFGYGNAVFKPADVVKAHFFGGRL